MSQHATVTSDPAAPLRFLDVGLIVLAAPFVAIAGLPLLGYAIGAGAWIVQRIVGEWTERRARASHDARTAVGLSMASIIARAWVVALAILAVGLGGTRDDGAMAAATVLIAFTIYFAMNLLLRSLERGADRR
jgi:Kef-type K+ transport system membrane component KefB